MSSSELQIFSEYCGSPSELWYVSSPYSSDDAALRSARMSAAREAVQLLINRWDRVVPFSPVVYTYELSESGVQPSEGWYNFDLVFLQHASTLVVLQLEGWESSVGVALEIAFAKAKGIPILFSKLDGLRSERLPSWLSE